MKRFLLVLVCFALASPAWALKNRRVPRQPQSPLAPVTETITGSPLTIVVGNDTSMQVYNSNVPGTGQFFPPDCAAGETADSGIFVSSGGTVFGPDFDNHPCGSASNSYTPLTPISMSPITGSGTSGDPFTVVIVANVGALMQMTETLTYVNGSATANIALSFAAIPPPATPTGGFPFNAFIGADLYLADNDAGWPYATPPGAAGSHGADANCILLQYTISFLGTTPANAYSANYYGTIWSELSAGALSNTVDPTCIDDGAALQWNETFAGQPIAITTGVSFTGQAVPAGATVPTLSVAGVAALVLLLAVVGYVLAKRTSLGA